MEGSLETVLTFKSSDSHKEQHMKLFKISQNINTGWDTYSDAVVVAPDATTAKTIHPDSMGKYFNGWPVMERTGNGDTYSCNRDDWANFPHEVKAEYIGEAAEHMSQGAVVCASFHAG